MSLCLLLSACKTLRKARQKLSEKVKTIHVQKDNILKIYIINKNQRELFLSEVNNRETIEVIEANNGMYCLQK